MKHVFRVLLLGLLLASPEVFAHTSTGSGSGRVPMDDEAVGSMPRTPKKVKACQSHTNADGFTASTACDSGGFFRMNPETGTADTSTQGTSQGDWKGSIDGIDGNDQVSLGADTTAKVNGEGGTIHMSGDSTVTATNPPGGGGTIVIHHAGGPTYVYDGQTKTVTTS